MDEKNMPKRKGSPPRNTITIGGIQVTTWRNTTRKGPNYAIVMHRRYQVGGQWKTTNSLTLHDIPKAIIALQDMYRWILGDQSKPE